jgi:hypothetical protein
LRVELILWEISQALIGFEARKTEGEENFGIASSQSV